MASIQTNTTALGASVDAAQAGKINARVCSEIEKVDAPMSHKAELLAGAALVGGALVLSTIAAIMIPQIGVPVLLAVAVVALTLALGVVTEGIEHKISQNTHTYMAEQNELYQVHGEVLDKVDPMFYQDPLVIEYENLLNQLNTKLSEIENNPGSLGSLMKRGQVEKLSDQLNDLEPDMQLRDKNLQVAKFDLIAEKHKRKDLRAFNTHLEQLKTANAAESYWAAYTNTDAALKGALDQARPQPTHVVNF